MPMPTQNDYWKMLFLECQPCVQLSASSSPSAMVGAAVAFLQHMLCFQKQRTWLPNTTHFTKALKTRRIHLISASSSPSSQSSETDTQTPESCVNLGLSLFSKGRVLFSDINAYEVDLGTDAKHCFCREGDLLAVVD